MSEGPHDDSGSMDTPLTDAAEKECCCTVNGAIIRGVVTAQFCRRMERELNAARVCAGVAAKERGEWATERDDLLKEVRVIHALRTDVEKLCEALEHIATGLYESYMSGGCSKAEAIEIARAAVARVKNG